MLFLPWMATVKYAFICFGPAREKVYFFATLALGGSSENNVEELKAGGRAAMHKNKRERENTNRATEEEAQGMNIGVKISAGIIAQNTKQGECGPAGLQLESGFVVEADRGSMGLNQIQGKDDECY